VTALSKNARVAGLLYIVASAVGVVRLLYIPSALFVHDNAAATAANIAAHEPLFRLGILSYLIAGVVWLFVPLALYRVFEEVDRPLALLMVILGAVMQTPMYVINTATDAAALLLVRDGNARMAMLFLRLHHHLDVANAIFAGLWLLPLGLLVYRSRLLPRVLGVWLMVACFVWLAFCVAGILFPGQEDKVFTMGQPFVLGEVATMLWLVVMGARVRAPAVAA
jgi:predicted phage tail protein